MASRLIFVLALCAITQFSFATVYTITNNSNSGTGTLRQAINDANSHPGTDSIKFNLPASDVVGRTITVTSALPTITDQLIIDGTSQPTGNNFGISFAKIQVLASGSLPTGLNITASDCEVYGLFINGFQTGISISGSSSQIGSINHGNVIFDCSIECVNVDNSDHAVFIANLIGVDTLLHAAPGNTGDGILVENSYAIAIGGHSTAASNVISGNDSGIKFSNSAFCSVTGNFIGISTDGITAIPNLYGIKCSGLDNNNMTIGGDSIFERNIISGNTHAGIYGLLTDSKILGNFIGTNATGDGAASNGDAGIFLTSGSNGNIIGGDLASEANVIAFNGLQAISLQSNLCYNNSFRMNSTFCNGQGGIDLNGGNDSIAVPQLTIANVLGVNGITIPNSTVEIFEDDTCAACEGKLFIASVTSNAGGVFSYTGPLTGSITATVSDSDGNTSEYTPCVEVSSSTCIIPAFTTSPQGICVNSLISFIDQSITAPGSTISSWSWDFGDGGSSSLQSPVHVFTATGTFPITLIVTNSLGCTDTLTENINVTGGPVAGINAPSIACAGSPISFLDASDPGAGAILSQWQWDFGDGITTPNQNPQHTYVDSGTFYITLSVTNNNGCQDEIADTINILAAPAAAFSYAANGLLVNFYDSSVANGPLSYSWNFGDGVLTNAANPVHLYNAAGAYTVCLGIYDSLCSSTDTTCEQLQLVVGIPDIDTASLYLTPNPASETVSVSSPVTNASAEFTVSDPQGRIIIQLPYLPTGLSPVDVSHWPNGIYLVRISDGQVSASRKLIVLH